MSLVSDFRVSDFKSKLSFLSPSTIGEITNILRKDAEDRTTREIDTLALIAGSVDMFQQMCDMRRQALFRTATCLVMIHENSSK